MNINVNVSEKNIEKGVYLTKNLYSWYGMMEKSRINEGLIFLQVFNINSEIVYLFVFRTSRSHSRDRSKHRDKKDEKRDRRRTASRSPSKSRG